MSKKQKGSNSTSLETKKKRGRPKGSKTRPLAERIAESNAPKKNIGGQPKNNNAEKWTEEKALELGNKLIEWMRSQPQNIWFQDFLYIQNDYEYNILHYLSEKFDSFSTLKKKADAIQEFKMQRYANSKYINPTIAVFNLKNKHGWTDRREDKLELSGNETTMNVVLKPV